MIEDHERARDIQRCLVLEIIYELIFGSKLDPNPARNGGYSDNLTTDGQKFVPL